MIFNPKVDPEGARAGTKGARILRIEPDRRLDFEWSVGVPSVSWDLKETDFATWVEVTLRAGPRPPGRDARPTGARRLPEAAEAGTPPTRYFEKSWRLVLDRLTAYVASGTRPW